MAKKIKNPIVVTIHRQNDGGVDYTKASASYGIEAEEYGIHERRSFVPTLTPAQQAIIEQVMDAAILLIKEHEGLS